MRLPLPSASPRPRAGRPVAKALCRIHERCAVQASGSRLRGHAFTLNRQQVADHRSRREHAFQRTDEHILVLAIPVIGEEVRQRQRGIITGHLRRQMIPRPCIAVIVNAGNVLGQRRVWPEPAEPNHSTAAGCRSGHSSAAC